VGVMDLSAGEPQFAAPEFASRAAIEAIRDGKTGYPPTPGLPVLRTAIARYLEETTAIAELDPNHVIVGAGVKQALFNCCFVLFGSGDDVLIPAPYWPSYPAIVGLSGANPVVVETSWEDQFQVTVDQLEEARAPNTRGLLLNSPSNPSGGVYSLERLAEVAAWCRQHGIWLLSDEIYRRLAFGSPAPSVYDLPELGERTVLFDGVSKAFCMPGFRIGYAVGPPALIKKMSDLQGQTTSGAVGPSQYAAAAALGERDKREAFVTDLLEKLNTLREIGLSGFGPVEALQIRAPAGALYFYARVRDPQVAALDIAERLLVDASVACVPGEPFGSPGHLRFNFAVERSVLEEALQRIGDFFS